MATGAVEAAKASGSRPVKAYEVAIVITGMSVMLRGLTTARPNTKAADRVPGCASLLKTGIALPVSDRGGGRPLHKS